MFCFQMIQHKLLHLLWTTVYRQLREWCEAVQWEAAGREDMPRRAVHWTFSVHSVSVMLSKASCYYCFSNEHASFQRMLPGVTGSSSSDVSPPHAIVANLLSRESSGYMASPTKFTTARGDTTSFSKIFQKVEEKHGQQMQQQHNQHNMPSTSYQMQPSYIISSKPESTNKLIAPIALKPQIMPMSGCSSIAASPITTPRITPSFRMLEDDSLVNALGHLQNSNDSVSIRKCFWLLTPSN